MFAKKRTHLPTAAPPVDEKHFAQMCARERREGRTLRTSGKLIPLPMALARKLRIISKDMRMPFLFGSHQGMKELERRIPAIARSGLPVLIEGACGTGKEAVAELLHALSLSGPGLTRIFCSQFGRIMRHAANGNGSVPRVDKRLEEALQAYDWPGNLRELENITRAYLVSGDAEEIIRELRSRSRTPETAPAAQGRSLKEQVKGAVQKLESEIILQALNRHRWNRRRTARSLQISYRSLLYKMKSCNLRPGARPASEWD